MRRERRDDPPVCVASLSVQIEPPSVPTQESRARDEELLMAIAAERADPPNGGPRVAHRRPARRARLSLYVIAGLVALAGLGLYAWQERATRSETAHAPTQHDDLSG